MIDILLFFFSLFTIVRRTFPQQATHVRHAIPGPSLPVISSTVVAGQEDVVKREASENSCVCLLANHRPIDRTFIFTLSGECRPAIC